MRKRGPKSATLNRREQSKVAEETIQSGIAAVKERLYTRQAFRTLGEFDLDALHDEFVEAARLYEAGDLDDQRYAVASQISLIYDFFGELGFSAVTLTPLIRPLSALAELKSDIADPLFAKNKRSGRPKRSFDQLNRIGVLAALTDFWLAAKGENEIADVLLSQATRLFKGRWFGNVTKAQLKSARILISQEAGDHEAVQSYEHFSTEIRKLSEELGPDQALAITVRTLNEAPASTALGNWKTLKNA